MNVQGQLLRALNWIDGNWVGADTDGEHVAIFGSFTLTSSRLKKTYTSPFSVFAKVKNGKITYLQYMEDTFGTAMTFRSDGSWTFQGDPNGAETTVCMEIRAS